VLEQKELKVASLTQEVNGLRSQVRSKDRTIFGFKRELSSMVHISLPKDLEQAVKVCLCVCACVCRSDGGQQQAVGVVVDGKLKLPACRPSTTRQAVWSMPYLG